MADSEPGVKRPPAGRRSGSMGDENQSAPPDDYEVGSNDAIWWTPVAKLGSERKDESAAIAACWAHADKQRAIGRAEGAALLAEARKVAEHLADTSDDWRGYRFPWGCS